MKLTNYNMVVGVAFQNKSKVVIKVLNIKIIHFQFPVKYKKRPKTIKLKMTILKVFYEKKQSSWCKLEIGYLEPV